ncbi:hypothetical protein ACFL3J_02245 [Candidatus Omnitrophota bacterium]
MDKIRKITFLYNSKDVDEYIRNNKSRACAAADELFIAVTPLAHSYLNKHAIASEDTLKYFTTESHRKLLKKSEKIVEWLQEKVYFVDLGIGVRQTIKDSFIFSMRLAVHYCLWVTEIVLNAVDEYKPEVIAASLSGKKRVSSSYMEPEEKYLGQIIQCIAKEKNLKFESISKRNRSYVSSISQLTSQISSVLKLFIQYRRFNLWEKKVLAENRLNKKRPVLFTTTRSTDALTSGFNDGRVNLPHYFLKDPIMPFLNVPDFIIRLSWRPYSKQIIEQKSTFDSLVETIKNEIEIFSYRGVSFAEAISQKLKDNVASYAVGQLLWLAKLDKMFDSIKPYAVLSTGNRRDDISLAELCRKKDVPDILFSHGSHVRPKNEYESIEWGEHGRSFLRAPFSFLALQSPLSEGYLETFPSASNVVKTGPLVWGRMIDLEKSKGTFNKMFGRKYDFARTRVVVHAGTPKTSKGLRLYVYETPDEYIRAICDLADTAEKMPDTILIIKFRARFEIGIDDLKRLVPFSKKVVLSTEESFNDVLGMSDLLVSFSSTTIEEALQNRIPVLLYGGNGRYQHIPACEIKADDPIKRSAIYHVKEARNLQYAIRNILDLGIKGKKDEALFNPYRYPLHDRVSVEDLLKTQLKNKVLSR